MQTLEKAMETYKALRPHLLRFYRGRFALIHDGDLVQIYHSESEARNAGRILFGAMGVYLVKPIVDAADEERLFVLPHINVQSA